LHKPSNCNAHMDPNISDINLLPPGASASATMLFTTAANLSIPGKSYPFIVKVTGIGGQNFTETLTVTCGS